MEFNDQTGDVEGTGCSCCMLSSTGLHNTPQGTKDEKSSSLRRLELIFQFMKRRCSAFHRRYLEHNILMNKGESTIFHLKLYTLSCIQNSLNRTILKHKLVRKFAFLGSVGEKFDVQMFEHIHCFSIIWHNIK